MARDDDKLLFSSAWEIDQLTATDEVSVSSGDTVVYTASGVTGVPDMKAQFKPSGSSRWFDEGVGSTNNTLANSFVFYTYISGTSLHAVAPSSGTVRYFVWKDRIDY